MVSNDFDRWLAYHGNAYPGFLKWLKDNKQQTEFMRRLLGHYQIDQLQQATDQLYASDEQPNGYSNHARAIRRLCNPDTNNTETAKEGPRVIDGRLTATCPRCMDYGVVEVLIPQCLKELWADDQAEPTPRLRTCVIACDCRLGSSKARRLKIVQWAEHHALLRFADVLDRALFEEKQYPSIWHAEWAVARQMLNEHHDQYNKAQELSGDVLP